MPASLLGGLMAAQYVYDHLFSWLFPALLGLAATWLAGIASYRQGLGTTAVVAIGAFASLIGTALGFRLYPHGPNLVLSSWSLVGLPYLAAIGGAGLWSVMLRPPNRRPEN
jgi:hypothetical protein